MVIHMHISRAIVISRLQAFGKVENDVLKELQIKMKSILCPSQSLNIM